MGGELIFDGKKYISATRAASICGYNSDYIGQLCRKGLLDCRRVGRAWFVCEDSVLSHKKIASQTPRGRIPMYQGNSETRVLSGNAGVMSQNVISPTFGIDPELAYRSFHQAAINFLDRKEERRLSYLFARRIGSAFLAVCLILVFVVPQVIGSSRTVDVLSQVNVGGIEANVLGSQIATSLGQVKKYQHDLVGAVAYSSHVFTSVGQLLDREITHFVNTVQIRFAGLDTFFAFGKKNGDRNSHVTPSNEGLVVVPAAQSEDDNSAIKEYVTNNFSDEAHIVPDESGNSGLIKPIFKNQTDQEYVYVMVPVKEEGP